MMSARRLVPVFLLAAFAATACSKDGDTPEAASGDVAISRHPNLQWKRYSAIEADLAQALELPPEELCTEFGVESCIHSVHLTPLGGNDPFKTGSLEPPTEPLATTPAVMDRLLVSACGRRTELDKAAKKSAKVFQRLDLDGDAPEPSDERVRQTVTDLYHRFLAREPEDSERAIVSELARDEKAHPVRADQFATLACFTIGTSTEFLFF